MSEAPARVFARSRPGSVLRLASSVSDDEVEDGETGDAEGEKYQGEKEREDRPGMIKIININSETVVPL